MNREQAIKLILEGQVIPERLIELVMASDTTNSEFKTATDWFEKSNPQFLSMRREELEIE